MISTLQTHSFQSRLVVWLSLIRFKNNWKTYIAKPDHLDFPELFFFQPKRLWVIKDNRVEAHYLSPFQPNDDWEQIMSTSDQHVDSIERDFYAAPDFKADYFAKSYALQQHIARGISTSEFRLNRCRRCKIEPYIFKNLMKRQNHPFLPLSKSMINIYSAVPLSGLKRVGNRLISQPIKGTARRYIDMVQDAAEASNCSVSEKERAETP